MNNWEQILRISEDNYLNIFFSGVSYDDCWLLHDSRTHPYKYKSDALQSCNKDYINMHELVAWCLCWKDGV